MPIHERVAAATGFRRLFDLATAQGGRRLDAGTVELPRSLGIGTVRTLWPEPGLRVAVHQCILNQEVMLPRRAAPTQPPTLLVAFNSFAPPDAAACPPVSSVQVASSDLEFTTVLPAHVALFTVGLAVEKALLRSWLHQAGQPVPELVTTQQPLVLEAPLTPQIRQLLPAFSAAQPAPFLPDFFYRLRAQELLYWLLVELAGRTQSAHFLHGEDVEKIYHVRRLLLASLTAPPGVATLAQAAGLGETKLKQLFRQVFGTSPYAYYQAYRMQEAQRLLATHSVAEVGYQLGFANLSHFARAFVKHCHLPPKKYQAALRKGSPIKAANWP